MVGLGVGNVKMTILEDMSSPGEAVMATIEKIHEKIEEIVAGSCRAAAISTRTVQDYA